MPFGDDYIARLRVPMTIDNNNVMGSANKMQTD